jgi:hypothetical protein
MNSKIKIILAVVISISLTSTALSQSYVGDVRVDAPSTVQVGEEFTMGAEAEGSDLQEIKIGEKFSDSSYFWLESESCIQTCTIENVEDTLYEQGEEIYAVRVNGVNNVQYTEEFTVNAEDPNIPVSLDSVSASRYDISSGDSTQLHATLSNSDFYGHVVKVVWKADDGDYSYNLGSRTESIGSESTEEVNSGFLDFDDLEEKGLDAGQEYNSKADYYFDSDGDGDFEDSEKVSTAQASRNILLVQENGEVSIESVTATKFDLSEGESTQLQTRISNSYTNYPREVTVKWFADDDSYPILLDETEETIQENSEEDIVSSFLSWQEIRDKGVDLEEEYNLKTEVSLDDQTYSGTANQNLILRETQTQGPFFDVSITGTNSPVDEGETLEVDYEVENTGDEFGEQIITLDVNGNSDSEPVELEGGETQTGTLRWETSSGDAGGYTGTVSSNDDEASSSVTVNEVDPPSPQGPTASLEVTPFESDVGETVTFNASGSRPGDSQIEEYKWDIDNDNSYEQTTSGSVLERTFDSPVDNGFAVVKVIDANSISDVDTERYSIVEADQRCDISGNSLDVPSSVDEGDIADVSVDVENNGDPQDVEVEFEAPGGDDALTITKNVEDSEVFSADLEPSESGDVVARIKTVGGPCGDGTQDTLTKHVEVAPSDLQESRITVQVSDEDQEPLRNAEVTLLDGSGSETGVAQTGSDGEVSFGDLSGGTYTVSASKDGFSSASRTFTISGEEHRTVYLDLVADVQPPPGDSRITVRVEDESGNALSDAEVSLTQNGDLGDSVTGVNGRVTFSGLAAGEYEVEAIKSGYSSDSTSVELTESQSKYVVLNLSTQNQPPEANFEYSPDNPQVNQEVNFDAFRSSDDSGIESYSWRFGDGSTAEGETTSHVFQSPSDSGYPVTLMVSDQENLTDSVTKYVPVGEPDRQCGVKERDVGFSLEENSIWSGDSTDAEVRIFNNAAEEQRVRVRIKVARDVVSDRTVTVDGFDNKLVTKEVSPVSDEFIYAEVSTVGEPCGRQQFEFNRELIVLQREEKTTSLDVNVKDEDGFPIRNAQIDVEGPEERTRFTNSDGERGFRLEPGLYYVTVSRLDYESQTETVRLFEGDHEDLDFTLERTRIEGEKGRLEIVVKDQDGDWVEDARVEVDGPEYDVERTNYYGLADFRLEEGWYDVEASHPDYDFDAETSVYVEEDETTSRTLRLDDRQRDSLRIVDTDYPSSVCRDDTLSVDVTVENRQDRDEFVTVTGKGLGSINVLNGFILEEDERETKTVRFTNVEGSGEEDFRIQARNGTLDEVEREVDVESCDVPERDARSVSMKLSYPIEPNSALVGDTVKVSGFVDGVQGRSEVTIEVNGDRKARVSTQPDGYYVTFISVDSVGEKTVRARSGGESVSREIQVLPTASISSLTAPRQVFEGETFEVCTEVNSQVDAALYFYEDGRLLNQVEDKGDRCFEVDASQPGLHTYRLRAATTGESSSATVSVQVLESDVEVDSFPGQIATVESGSGNVKVELYNTHDELKRYDLQLEGLPSTWISQSEKQVVLDSGKRKEVFFYLTPRNQGDYDPEVVVEADNQIVYQQKVDLETGGYTEGRDTGFLSSLTNLLPF